MYRIRIMGESCIICYDTYNRDTRIPKKVLPCNHVFCEPCITHWKNKHINTVPSCPCCRTPIQSLMRVDTILSTLHITKPRGPHYSKFEIIPSNYDISVYIIDNTKNLKYNSDRPVHIYQGYNNGWSTIESSSNNSSWGELVHTTMEIVTYNLHRKMYSIYFFLNPLDTSHGHSSNDYIVIDPECADINTQYTQIQDTLLNSDTYVYPTTFNTILGFIHQALNNFIHPAFTQCRINLTTITINAPSCSRLYMRSLSTLCRARTIYLNYCLCSDSLNLYRAYRTITQTIHPITTISTIILGYSSEKRLIKRRQNILLYYRYDIHICRMAGCFSDLSRKLSMSRLTSIENILLLQTVLKLRGEYHNLEWLLTNSTRLVHDVASRQHTICKINSGKHIEFVNIRRLKYVLQYIKCHATINKICGITRT